MSVKPGSTIVSSLFRIFLIPVFILGFSVSGFAQAEKYANITDYPDAQILKYLQNAYPNDKLNYYDVKLNGRMQHVKNYYDYISFRCVLLDSEMVKPSPAAAADTLRSVTPDSAGVLRDSSGQRVDSARLTPADSALPKKPDSTGSLSANTSSQLAAVLSATDGVRLSDSNVLSRREVDSSWVLADTLISARRGITHSTENSVPISTITQPSPIASSYTITADTIYMINCGANAEHRPSLVWIYHSKDPSTHIVIGAGDFKEEMLMLQSFCDGLGAKLAPYHVEIWDLFVKSHQSAMYTPVYDHVAHYSSVPVADGPAPEAQ